MQNTWNINCLWHTTHIPRIFIITETTKCLAIPLRRGLSPWESTALHKLLPYTHCVIMSPPIPEESDTTSETIKRQAHLSNLHMMTSSHQKKLRAYIHTSHCGDTIRFNNQVPDLVTLQAVNSSTCFRRIHTQRFYWGHVSGSTYIFLTYPRSLNV